MVPIIHIVTLAALLTATSAFASGSIPVSVDTASLHIGRHLEYYVDSENTDDPVSLAKRGVNWTPYDGNYINFGFSSSTHWFKGTLLNEGPLPVELLLEINYAVIDEAELHYRNPDGVFRKVLTGDSIPFARRPIEDHNLILPLVAGPGETPFYLRIRTTSSINFSPVITTREALQASRAAELPLTWIYYGILIVMALYNLFLFLSLRESAFLHYSLFITSFILFQFTLKGLSFQYLWPDWVWWGNNSLPFFMSLSIVFFSLFVKDYLETRTSYPALDRWIIRVGLIPGSLAALISLSGAYRLSIMLTTILALLVCLVCFPMGTYLVVKGSRRARFLLIAFSVVAIGISMYTLKTLGFVPQNLFSERVIQIGAVLVVLLFSLGLADRINTIKNKVMELNLSLEQKVVERTSQLNSALEEMETINENLFRLNGELALAEEMHRKDMLIAESVQSAFFTREIPPSSRYDIAFEFMPMQKVSGDFYDFYLNCGDLEGVGLFDVSGHGISSGLLTLMAKSIIYRNYRRFQGEELGKVMEIINRELIAEIGHIDHYLSGILLRFREDSIDYVNASHPQILLRKGNPAAAGRISKRESREISGPLLGLEGMNRSFPSFSFRLDKGDCILLYSDCLLEGRNKEGEQYGEERIIKSMGRDSGVNAREILDCVMRDFFAHVEDEHKLSDDLTAIAIMKK